MDATGSKKKLTIVLGASTNPNRYSHLAVQRLREKNHPVIAIGKRRGMIDQTEIHLEPPETEQVDTVSLYLNPINQKEYYNYILSLRPRRLIFNPGTENEELFGLAATQGIQALNACTLVLLATNQF